MPARRGGDQSSSTIDGADQQSAHTSFRTFAADVQPKKWNCLLTYLKEQSETARAGAWGAHQYLLALPLATVDNRPLVNRAILRCTGKVTARLFHTPLVQNAPTHTLPAENRYSSSGDQCRDHTGPLCARSSQICTRSNEGKTSSYFGQGPRGGSIPARTATHCTQ